ncbi:MAG: TIM barrel protein [Phycisphaerales bacterium]
MMYSLNVNSIRSLLKKRGKNTLTVQDLPKYTRENMDLRALNLSTDLLKGMGRSEIARIRDNGDKVGCTCLMLSEPEALDMAGSKGDASVDRMSRVIIAGSVLGCNAVSMSIKAPDTDDAFDAVVDHMKEVLESADSADINVLIAPNEGLTSDPDRATDLVKAIGGFRIGTLPDFQAAHESGDPVHYLRRLTPYATVVNASTLKFEEAEPDDEAMQAADGLSGLDALAAELEAMDDSAPPKHVGYDLEPLVGAIKAVGFSGNIALDYRGDDDGTLGVLQTRDAIEAALVSLAES